MITSSYEHRLEAFGFEHPEDVGSSEYWAICECIEDGLKSQDEDDSPSGLIDAMLTQFIEQAQWLRVRLKDEERR